jgi:hypothetical protein
VSVIAAPILPGFALESLGDPRDAAGRFLATLAPPGSGLEVGRWGAGPQGGYSTPHAEPTSGLEAGCWGEGAMAWRGSRRVRPE